MPSTLCFSDPTCRIRKRLFIVPKVHSLSFRTLSSLFAHQFAASSPMLFLNGGIKQRHMW